MTNESKICCSLSLKDTLLSMEGQAYCEYVVKSKFSTNNFKKIRIPQFSETRFGSFVGLFLVYKQ